MTILSLNHVHSSWHDIIKQALSNVDSNYLQQLNASNLWLPGSENIFNAFSIPLDDTRYVLFGESPYPRKESANGYAFWDAAVTDLWSETGLSKRVNRATSLRNFIKMLFISEGLLSENDVSQTAIAAINKASLVSTGEELFQNFLKQGFLLLNACLVLSDTRVGKEAKHWQPFLFNLLHCLAERKFKPKLIMLGNIAQSIAKIPSSNQFEQLISEHPYNVSFVSNPNVRAFFGTMHLLNKSEVIKP